MAAKNASSIQVCIKVRPCEPGLTSLWQVKEGRSIHLADSHADPCVFDYVFDGDANNQMVFDRMAKHIVHACMQGFNGTIFAYGQTSSGKTYTMMGDGDNPGVMVLAAKEIFQQISSETERDFLLRVGYIEIYNEKIYDLLNKKNQDLKIHESGNGVVNVNCEECIITSEDDLLRLLSMGNKERTVGETNMNERSSRSHAIFRIIIESRKSDRSDDDAVIQSVLNLVDLAGSERADQTGARGARLKEGGHINKSLLFLSNVIKSLSENVDNKFISFRDSKLTRILQASLGGNALTSIICTIKPSIMEESQSTLSFAMRAKKIRIKPQVNEIVSDATMMKRLEREIKVLKDKLAEEERKNESQLKVQDLEQRIKRDMHKIISSNSLSDNRQQKRRRTWCPAASGPESKPVESGITDDRLLRFSKVSHLPKPEFFPNSNQPKKWDNIPKTINILSSLDIGTDGNSINEEFLPAECVDFGSPRPDVHKALLTSRRLPDLTLTPIASQMGPLTMEKVKKEVQDLQMFTILEKHFEKECEEVLTLKEKLVEVTSQRDQLEQDFLNKKECYDALQEKVSTLTADNEIANLKIGELKEHLSALKQNVAKLEVENREAVSLEFEFKAHKKTSKLRENDLLLALSEKDLAIENLQKSLDNLSRDVLRNSKEDHMRSMCPEPEDSSDGNCHKCGQLEQLLVTAESKNAACECDHLRSEIAHAKTKLDSFEAFSQASREDSTRAMEECQSLCNQLSKAQEDFAQLQERYDKLQQQWEAQQLASKILQADHDVVRENYQRLKKECDDMGRTSSTSSVECQQLRIEKTNLQKEILILEERVEEAQRMLKESQNSEPAMEKINIQNQKLKAKLTELETNFEEIQREYDCLSNQLMESVQENDALREELKQRSTNYDLLSMKSSGISTGFCEPEHEPNIGSDVLQQFIKLSESVQQIELQHHSGFGRLFNASNPGKDQNSPVLKLCLQSAEYVEGDTEQLDTYDSVCLKGFLKRHRFQIMSLSPEDLNMGRDKRLLDIISQLEKEVEEKSALMEATEATINEMREQMTSLESALLEKSVIVNKVEDYQRQIECLEKQNAEMTMVYEELQDRVTRENSLSESLLRIQPDEDTLPGNTLAIDTNNKEADALKASLAEQKNKVCELQAKLENQVAQIHLKDDKIVELQKDFEEMSERCLSMEVRLAELEEDTKQKQELLDRQAQKLSDDLRTIDQLQERNAQLSEKNISSEVEQNQLKDLRESLKTANEQLIDMQKIKEDKMQALQDEYMLKIEEREKENREISQKLKECAGHYDAVEASLKEQLLQAKEELSTATASYQTDLERLKCILQENINQAERERNNLTAQHQAELEKIREILNQNLAEAKAQNSQIKDQLEQAEEEQKIAQSKLEEMSNSFEEMKSHIVAKTETISYLENMKAEQDLALDKLQMEKIRLEKLYDNSQEQLQAQAVTQDQNFLVAQSRNQELDLMLASSNEKIKEFKEKCEEQVRDLDKLRQEKIALQLEVENISAQHLTTLKKLEELQAEIGTLSEQRDLGKQELEEKLNTFLGKIGDLEEKLQDAQVKVVGHTDLLSEHERLKLCLASANELASSLQNTVKCLQSELLHLQQDVSSRDLELEKLRLELKHAVDAKTTASTEQLHLEHKLKEVEAQMSGQTLGFQRQVKDLKGSIVELQLKFKSLEEKKDSLESENDELKVRLRNVQNLEKTLEELEKINADLKAQIQDKDVEIIKKSTDIGLETELGRKKIEELNKECESLRFDLETKIIQFQREKESFGCTISHLQSNNHKLEEKLTMLRENNEENANKAALASMKQDSTKHQLAMEAANNKKIELEQKVHELTTECDKIRSDLQSKDACFLKEKESLDATISNLLKDKRSLEEKLSMFNDNVGRAEELAKEFEELQATLKSKEAGFRMEEDRMAHTIDSLLEDKRNLEEKLCTVSEIMAKLEHELAVLQPTKVNESNAFNGSPVAPTARRSLDRSPGASGPRKSLELRKKSRISVHDERRQSYWNDYRECGTMTDPVDNKCNCVELNAKLQECQRQSFIHESQVTALTLELMHHPLKDENAQLKKRVLDEQEKARSEQKRLKTKLQDLNAKINDLTNTAALSAKSVGDQAKPDTTSLRPATVPAQTQTESDLESILEKTNIKYQDAVSLLRFRYNLIKELEEKLRQNENNDTSNITSLSAGQYSALKIQFESQKKEMATIKSKYETAKRILVMRKDELDQMREQLAKYEPSVIAK